MAAPQGEVATPETVSPGLPPVTSFDELGLPPELLTTLTGLGVTEPFPVQAATLPNALAGRDVLGRARTGSGKTLAFGLALLARTAGRRAEPKQPLALVLVPTRELAQQVDDVLAALVAACRLLADELAPFVPGAAARIGEQVGPTGNGTLPPASPLFTPLRDGG